MSKFLSNSISATFSLQLERRQKILSKFALVFACILTFYAITVFLVMPGITLAKVVVLAAVFFLFGISYFSKIPKYYTASAIGIVAINLLGAFGGSLSNGGIDGYVAPALITTPIAAALFLGTRATLMATLSVVLAVIGLYITEQIGFVTETPYSTNITSVGSAVLLITATLISAAGVGFFALDTDQNIRRIRAYQEDLKFAAYHDPLTGLANRKKLEIYFEELSTFETAKTDSIYLIHLDLDRFKPVNDTYGHHVGDAVLQHVAEILQENCDADDIAIRIGGDEFIITKHSNSTAVNFDIQAFSESLIEQMQQPINVDGVILYIGASIGYTKETVAKANLAKLLKFSDLALYESKRMGRGLANPFAKELSEKVETRRLLLIELNESFENGAICCLLQPQFCLQSGRILGVEALGRIRRKDGSLLSPVSFLSEIEEIGRLGEFDVAVLRAGLDGLLALRKDGFDVPSVSINASGASLRTLNYVQTLLTELQVRNLQPKDLKVEVLESVLIEDTDDVAAKTLKALQTCGIKTVLDDFGAGHASIASLLTLSISGFKVDRALIADIKSENSIKAMRAVQKLSEGLNLPTVVEGVESPEQHAAVKSLGYEAVQGFGVCKPMEADKLSDWLRSYGKSNVSNLETRLKHLNLV